MSIFGFLLKLCSLEPACKLNNHQLVGKKVLDKLVFDKKEPVPGKLAFGKKERGLDMLALALRRQA